MNKCEQSQANAKRRGYAGELAWLEWMNRRYTQHKCKKCNRYHIFKRKEHTR